MDNNAQIEMDTDQSDGTKAVKKSGASGVEVSLHPMVILNISECHTRLKVQCPNRAVPLVGAIIGKHQGRKIEILNSFELPLISTSINGKKNEDNQEVSMEEDNERPIVLASGSVVTSKCDTYDLDQEYFEEKVEQYKQVFPDYELVGWFAMGDDIDDFDRSMFAKVTKMHGKGSEKFSENPLVLKLNPQMLCSKTLPVKVYESYLKPVGSPVAGTAPSPSTSGPEVCFTEVLLGLETEDGEKIALDHVAENQTSSGSVGNSSVSERFRIQSRAVRMLRDRVKTIVDFVDDAEKNGIEIDPDIQRQIGFIANRLPMCFPEGDFENDLNVQFNDNALLVYLGTLTKCSATINRYVSRLNSFMPE